MEGVEDAYVLHHYLKPNKVKVYEGENGSERTFDTPESRCLTKFNHYFPRWSLTKSDIGQSQENSLLEKYGSVGRFLGGTVNFGYSNENKTWVENKKESKVVRELFKRYTRGQKIKDLKNWLDAENIRPRRAKTCGISETIRKMLNNEVYTGVFVWVSKTLRRLSPIEVPQLVSHLFSTRFNPSREKPSR